MDPERAPGTAALRRAPLTGTLTHQPDYKTRFPDYAEYVTTNRFIVDHLVVSILGTAIGMIGILAFAQPAIGNAYLAGQRAAAVTINNGVYGPRTIAVALVGIGLYIVGGVLLARAAWRSEYGVRCR